MKALIILFTSLSFFLNASGDPVSQVQTALKQQVTAWNSGELENAMSFYWNSPELLWVNRGGIHKGYQSVFEDYKKSYTDRTKMGIYSIEPLHIEAMSTDLVYYVFKWKIELDGKKQMGGVSSQMWKKIDNKWRIISEHAS